MVSCVGFSSFGVVSSSNTIGLTGSGFFLLTSGSLEFICFHGSRMKLRKSRSASLRKSSNAFDSAFMNESKSSKS